MSKHFQLCNFCGSEICIHIDNSIYVNVYGDSEESGRYCNKECYTKFLDRKINILKTVISEIKERRKLPSDCIEKYRELDNPPDVHYNFSISDSEINVDIYHK